jgi:hypothetical protein
LLTSQPKIMRRIRRFCLSFILLLRLLTPINSVMRSVGPAPARVRDIRLKMFKQPITNHQSHRNFQLPSGLSLVVHQYNNCNGKFERRALINFHKIFSSDTFGGGCCSIYDPWVLGVWTGVRVGSIKVVSRQRCSRLLLAH